MENWFWDLEIHTKTVQWEVLCKSNRGELSQRRCFTPEHHWRGTTAAQKMPFYDQRKWKNLVFAVAAFTKNTTHGFVRKRRWRCADKVAEWRVIKPINGNEVAQWCLVTNAEGRERKKPSFVCQLYTPAEQIPTKLCLNWLLTCFEFYWVIKASWTIKSSLTFGP